MSNLHSSAFTLMQSRDAFDVLRSTRKSKRHVYEPWVKSSRASQLPQHHGSSCCCGAKLCLALSGVKRAKSRARHGGPRASLERCCRGLSWRLLCMEWRHCKQGSSGWCSCGSSLQRWPLPAIEATGVKRQSSPKRAEAGVEGGKLKRMKVAPAKGPAKASHLASACRWEE